VGDLNYQHNRAVWFDIPVADLDRSQAFYAAVLGVGVSRETFGETSFCVIDHEAGNGGCRVLSPEQWHTGDSPSIGAPAPNHTQPDLAARVHCVVIAF
jgi:hypothetical protein